MRTSETSGYNLGDGHGGREMHPPVLSILPSCHLRKMLKGQHSHRGESAISCLLCLHWDGDGLWKRKGFQRKLSCHGSPSKFICNQLNP